MSSETKLAAMGVAMTAVLTAAKEGQGAALPLLDAALAEIGAGLASRPDSGAGARKTACRHLERATQLALAGPREAAQLAIAFAALEPLLTWRQNPNYTAENLGAHYLDNYAYTDIVGPNGLAASERVAMGVLLLGPGLHYPDHDHEAEELYLPLSGDSLWRSGEGDWQAKPAGSLIHHPPWTRHAMKARNEPLFAFYVWRGALNRPARLIE